MSKKVELCSIFLYGALLFYIHLQVEILLAYLMVLLPRQEMLHAINSLSSLVLIMKEMLLVD